MNKPERVHIMPGETQSGQHRNTIFHNKKRKILQSLDRPSESYHDASPKGSVDEPIRELIELINSIDAFVTTSSCSGRVAVFVESNSATRPLSESHQSPAQPVKIPSEPVFRPATDSENKQYPASSDDPGQQTSGKGAGGRWLFVSHGRFSPSQISSNPVATVLGFSKHDSLSENAVPPQMSKQTSIIHFKFEPMVIIDPNPHACKVRCLHSRCHGGTATRATQKWRLNMLLCLNEY